MWQGTDINAALPTTATHWLVAVFRECQDKNCHKKLLCMIFANRQNQFSCVEPSGAQCSPSSLILMVPVEPGWGELELKPCLKLDQDFYWQPPPVYIFLAVHIFCTVECNLSIESFQSCLTNNWAGLSWGSDDAQWYQ